MRCDFPSLPTDWVAAFVELALQGSLPRAAGILHATEFVIDLTGAGVATARPGMTRAGSGGARRGLCMNSPARRPVKRNPPGAVRFVELPPLRFAGRRPLHRLILRAGRGPGLTKCNATRQSRGRSAAAPGAAEGVADGAALRGKPSTYSFALAKSASVWPR